MNQRLPILLLLWIASLMILSTRACRCVDEPTVTSALESGPVVTGMVLRELPAVPDADASSLSAIRRFLVRIQNVYASDCAQNPPGGLQPRQHMIVASARNSCGVPIQKLQSYIFSGNVLEAEDAVATTTRLGMPNATLTLGVSLCTFTRPWIAVTLSERQALKAVSCE